MSYYRNNKRFVDVSIRRLFIVLIFFFALGLIIITRLFFIQVFQQDKYLAIAHDQHEGGITIPARRGEILTKNGDNYFKLATNITLDLLFVDPSLTPDKKYVAELLAPLIYTDKDYEACLDDEDLCPGSLLEFDISDEIDSDGEAREEIPEHLREDSEEEKDFSKEEFIEAHKQIILDKISKDVIDYKVLKSNVSDNTQVKISSLHIPGLIVEADKNIIAVNPLLIREKERYTIAKILEPILNLPVIKLTKMITPVLRQYVPLKRKLDPEIARKIRELKIESSKKAYEKQVKDPLRGVALKPEHWRYYPNETLASQLIGFFNQYTLSGQYGIEESFHSDLEGKQGKIFAEKDPSFRPITFGEDDIISAENGDSFVLTIIPTIQRKIEEIMKRKVEDYKAKSGQVILMDPFSGEIFAMVSYPSFDPNTYSDVYKKIEAPKREIIPEYFPVFIKKDDSYTEATTQEREDKDLEKFVYENMIGPEAYRNKAMQDIYEPGSVFKPLAMAIALDRFEVTPQTKYYDTGEMKTDEFIFDEEIIIHNANNTHHGWVNMTNCLEESINTCMAFIAEKLGRKLFYSYIKDFGFGDFTDIELSYEEVGKVIFWDKWSKTQLMTTAFGQGIAATPLQVITAWSALANGGLLIKPTILHSTIASDGTVTINSKKVVRRVLSKETSSTITAMLVSTVNNGVAKTAQIPHHSIAGKTGTSQIADTKGRGYEEGEGSTITSFLGYAPVSRPKYIMLVKFDRPRVGVDNTWGSTTAAPTFKEISEFLFTYFNIPPDS